LFTGLIEDTGLILRSGGGCISLCCSSLEGIRTGESVSVDGVCLTVTGASGSEVSFHASGETVGRSVAAGYTKGTEVNIERPLIASGKLHGHLVTGHVDCTARVLKAIPSGADRLVWISLDSACSGLVVEKGSVAINGISLTVASIRSDMFSAVLIPETLDRTNASSWKPGKKINLEFDIIGKYVMRYLRTRDGESRLKAYLEEKLEH
jgi:riboflavin synthase